MALNAIFLVLCAAFLHALWNAAVKGAPDKVVMLGLVSAGHAIPAAFLLPFFGLPVAQAFPFVVASTLIHWLYYWFLGSSYKYVDFSIAYPIARGISPVLVALGAMIWAHEYLALWTWLGILCISIGIGILIFTQPFNRAGVIGFAFAIATGLMIAAYSIVDGIGIRNSENPIGYILCLFVAEILVTLFVVSTRWQRVVALPQRYIWIGLAGGIISGLAYGLVLYVKFTSPLGVVSALRECSVIFAAMIGVYWFGEGAKFHRLVASVVVASGILVLILVG